MNILNSIKKIGIDLFFYYFKGARIDGALIWNGRNRLRTMIDHLVPNAKPIIENEIPIAYDANDILMGFQIITKAQLKLKNNSKNFAYNLHLLYAKELFSEFKDIKKLTSLAPNESIEIDVEFHQFGYFNSGVEADALPDISNYIENKILNIQYENESGTKFLTKFWVSFTTITNQYTYS